MKKSESALVILCLILLASCTTKFSEKDGHEDGEDGLEMDGDGGTETDGMPECSAGPCCDTDTGRLLGPETVCDGATEYRCEGGCGAEAQTRTIEQHCSGAGSECDGEVTGMDWVTAPDGECGSDQICVTDGSTSASCVTCEAGCNAGTGTCETGCTPGPLRPCCGEDGRLLDASRVCDTFTQMRCTGTRCGDDVERREAEQHCSGASSDCSGEITGEWTVVTDCEPASLCRQPYGEDPFCDPCPNGCDPAADACFAECSPDEPCCDGSGHFQGPDVRCETDPVRTEYLCESAACGGDAVERLVYRHCTGTSSECGDGNLQSQDFVTSCTGEIVCESDGTYAACRSCEDVCANTSSGVGLCYDDPYEWNNSASEAFGIDFAVLIMDSKLNGDFDPVDFFGFSLDESGGESYLVTAMAHVTAVSGAAPHRIVLAFTAPDGRRITEEVIASAVAGDEYNLAYVLSGESPTPDRFAFSVSTDVSDLAMDYFIRLTATPISSDSINCGLVVDAYEPNNVLTEAFDVSLDTVYPMATLCRLVDTNDYFRFVVPETNPVKVTARANILDSSNDDGNFVTAWLRSDGREYAISGSSCWTGVTTAFYRTFNPGTYYVLLGKIYPDDIFINYTFNLETSSPCSDDAHDLPPSDDDFEDGAVTVSSGDTINGVFCYLDADWREIYLGAGQNLVVGTTVPSYLGPMRTIINRPDSNECINVTGDGPGPQEAVCTAGEDGTYGIMTMIWADQRSYTQTFNVM